MKAEITKARVVLLKPAVLDLPTLCTYTTLSESTIQKLVRQNEFPKPRQLSGRRVGWLTREVEEWLDGRPVADMLPPINCGFGQNGRPEE